MGAMERRQHQAAKGDDHQNADQKLHDEVSYDVFVIDDKKSKVTSRSAHAARLVLTGSGSRGTMPQIVTYQVPLAFDLPPGEYLVRVWHPSMEHGEETTSRRLTVSAEGPSSVEWDLSLKPAFRVPRVPGAGSSGYP